MAHLFVDNHGLITSLEVAPYLNAIVMGTNCTRCIHLIRLDALALDIETFLELISGKLCGLEFFDLIIVDRNATCNLLGNKRHWLRQLDDQVTSLIEVDCAADVVRRKFPDVLDKSLTLGDGVFPASHVVFDEAHVNAFLLSSEIAKTLRVKAVHIVLIQP